MDISQKVEMIVTHFYFIGVSTHNTRRPENKKYTNTNVFGYFCIKILRLKTAKPQKNCKISGFTTEIRFLYVSTLCISASSIVSTLIYIFFYHYLRYRMLYVSHSISFFIYLNYFIFLLSHTNGHRSYRYF